MKAASRIGTVLAGHRIESILGRGGASVVYLAEHVRLGRKVALKLLAPELAEEEGFRERFERESRIAAALDHPNVVTVFDAGEADGLFFISMQFVEGADLERLLRSERVLDPERAIGVLSQVASALDAAHGEGLVHRDVKPANILLSRGSTPPERAYLSDFGVTKRLRSSEGLTRTGHFVGTVDYVAPEQIAGGPVDARADTYSLGCVLYRCLSGEVPFPADSDLGVIYAHVNEPPPRVSERRPDLPAALDAVIVRALAKSADTRHPTSGALIDDARTVFRGGLAFRHEPRAARHAPMPPSGVRRLARAAIAAGVVATLAVVSFLAFPRTRVASREHPLAITPGAPSPAATSPPEAWKPRLTWNEVPGKGKVFGGPGNEAISRAAVAGSVLVAVGHDQHGGVSDAAVWISRNGRRWQRPPSPSFGEPGDQQMTSVASMGSRVIAVGWASSGADLDAAVWVSPDRGQTWKRAGLSTLGQRTGDQVMRRIVVTPSGLVAVGSDAITGDLNAAVWTSRNGKKWLEEGKAALGGLGGLGDQEMRSVVPFRGGLVGVGYETLAGDQDAAVWRFDKGSWTRVPSDGFVGPGAQEMHDVVLGGPGLVVVGDDRSGGDFDGAVWTSRDGERWTREARDALGGPQHQEMFAVIRYGPGLLAAGSDGEGAEQDGAIWASADGLTWTHIPGASFRVSALGGFGQKHIQALIPFGDYLMALGARSADGNEDADVWLAKVPKSQGSD